MPKERPSHGLGSLLGNLRAENNTLAQSARLIAEARKRGQGMGVPRAAASGGASGGAGGAGGAGADRSHACSQCNAAFGKASTLTRHVRTVHEKRRDHACPQCEAAFGQAGNLRAHVRTVHEQHKDGHEQRS